MDSQHGPDEVRMGIIERIHSEYLHNRRVRVLSQHLGYLIPQNARVLDVGCGDGLLDYYITQNRPDIKMKAIDTLVRGDTHVPVDQFDGRAIPHDDASFDIVMFVDVLHHAEDPMLPLREAVRVVRNAIVIKDHLYNGFLAGPILRFMDRVGNDRHGVALPYNYWSRQKWIEAFDSLGLTIDMWNKDVGLYPFPFSLLFDRNLHFIAKLSLSRPLKPAVQMSV